MASQTNRATPDSILLHTPITPRRECRRSRHASANSRHASASSRMSSLGIRRGSSYQEYVNCFDKAFADALKGRDGKEEKHRHDDDDEKDGRITFLVVYFLLFFGVLLVDKRAVLNHFLRDELQYTDGFERQELFHNNDKLISVDDLWDAWKHSSVHNWTVDDMIEWLVQDVDLPQYSQVFYNFAIDGSVLPRLVNSTSPLLTSLGIRNPVHKQKISLKAMDTILFGAPKRLHSYAKDVMLFMAILLAIGISWFACLHHRYSQTQVKKMMKDLEALQKAEDALKKLSKELADAENPQTSLPAEKQEELRMLRQNSLRLQVPRLSSGDRSPSRQNRDNSPRKRQEGEIKLKQAEEELANLRRALTDAENRLEIQQQLESQWSIPGELQAWLQLTYELEQLHFIAKRQAAERQLLAARDGCEKVKKRKQALFGTLRMAHSNSLDDIDQSILDARAALEEVKQDLQERLHRWHTIEVLCCFPVISNPGLGTLKQALGRDTGGAARLTTSMISPVTFEEADEDLSPTDDNRGSENIYNQIPEKQRQQIFAWAHRSRHSYWTRKTTNDDNRDSENIYNQIPERPRQQIFAWAHRSRLNNWMKKKTLTNGYTAAATIPVPSKTSTLLKQPTPTGSSASLLHSNKVTSVGNAGAGNVKSDSQEGEQSGSSTGISPATITASSSAMFHLGESSHHERSQSSASLSLMNSSFTNGNLHGHVLGKSGTNQFNHGTATPSGLHISSSSGNLLTNKPSIRAGSSSARMYTSASGNHLLAKANLPQSNNQSTASIHNHSETTKEKPQVNDTGDKLNNDKLPPDFDATSNSEQAGGPQAISDAPIAMTDSHQTSNDLDDVDADISGSIPKEQTQLGYSPELNHSNLDTDSLNHSRNGGTEMSAEKKNRKKKTILPRFLQKNKGKQKTL